MRTKLMVPDDKTARRRRWDEGEDRHNWIKGSAPPYRPGGSPRKRSPRPRYSSPRRDEVAMPMFKTPPQPTAPVARPQLQLTASLPLEYIRGRLINPVFVCLALFEGASEILSQPCRIPGAQVIGSVVDARPWVPIETDDTFSARDKTPSDQGPSSYIDLSLPPQIYNTISFDAQAVQEPPLDRRKRRRRKYQTRRSSAQDAQMKPKLPPPVRYLQSGSDWELQWESLGAKRIKYFFATRCQTAGMIVSQFLRLYDLLSAKIHRITNQQDTSLDDESGCSSSEMSWELGMAAFRSQEACCEFRRRLQLTIEVLRGEFNYDELICRQARHWISDYTQELEALFDSDEYIYNMRPSILRRPGKPLSTEDDGLPIRIEDNGAHTLDFSTPRIKQDVDLSDLVLVPSANADTSSTDNSVKSESPIARHRPYTPKWLERYLIPVEVPPSYRRRKLSPPLPPTARRWSGYDSRRY